MRPVWYSDDWGWAWNVGNHRLYANSVKSWFRVRPIEGYFEYANLPKNWEPVHGNN